MPRAYLDHCQSLLDSGENAHALAELIRLKAESGLDTDAVASMTKLASKRCSTDYPRARGDLLRMINESDSIETVVACLEAFFRFNDFSALKECRNIKRLADDSLFFMGFEDFVDTYLTSALSQGEAIGLGQSTIAGVRVDCTVPHGATIVLSRDMSEVDTPHHEPAERIELGTRVWATAFDALTDTYIVTLSDDDRVLRVNRDTLETELVIESPAPGVRGVGIVPHLRKGFFVSEFGNAMFSFDLDRFEIRKEIRGFSVRPERIRVDEVTNTVITGNLGRDLYFPFSVFRQKLRRICTEDGKVTDGMSISVVDAEAEEVIHTLPAGRRPTAVGISARYMAAGNFYDNTLTVYDRNDLGTSRVIVLDAIPDIVFPFNITDPTSKEVISHSKTLRTRIVEGISILDRRGWILVSGYNACILTIVDIQSGKIIGLVPVQDGPFDVVVDDAEKYAYVSCRDSAQVSVVDLDQRREVCRLGTGQQPGDPLLWGNVLLVPDSTGVTVFDTAQIPHV